MAKQKDEDIKFKFTSKNILTISGDLKFVEVGGFPRVYLNNKLLDNIVRSKIKRPTRVEVIINEQPTGS